MNFPQISLLNSAFLVIALLIVWSMYRAHKDEGFKSFNLFDLIFDGGRVSRIAFVFMGTWFVTSAIMWKLVVENKMTEGYFAAYCAAWIAPIISKLFTAPSTTTTTVSTSSTEISTEKKS